jgi:fructose-1,6-bisphosphatase I
VQGEVQKKLDVIANEVLIEANEWGGHLAGMASEEMDSIHVVPHRYPQGEYLLLFDPLDGSSNIDVNVSIGTIFSVLRKVSNHRERQRGDFPAAGQAAGRAGYCVYGPQTTLVLTVGDGVAMFTLDRETGSWVLTQDTCRSRKTPRSSPSTCRTCATGPPRCKRYIDECLPARTALAARTSTCAGWPRWWPTCTAS